IRLAERCAKDPWEMPKPPAEIEAVTAKLRAAIADDLKAAYQERVKQVRYAKIDAVKAKAKELCAGNDAELAVVGEVFKNLEAEVLRNAVLDTGIRIDGRDTKSIRPITCEVGVLPRTHGAALFTRGETQALVVTTLGTGQDEQVIDALTGEYREH